MDLFQALPALRHHPLLNDKRVALVGISTIVHDDEAHYFEISKPNYSVSTRVLTSSGIPCSTSHP
jgi:hypothetical protein